MGFGLLQTPYIMIQTVQVTALFPDRVQINLQDALAAGHLGVAGLTVQNLVVEVHRLGYDRVKRERSACQRMMALT